MRKPGRSLCTSTAFEEALPQELSFLAAFFSNDPNRYEVTDWLKSGFHDAVWEIRLDSEFRISWDVQVGSSGKSLLASDHARLLSFFKQWLVVQTHPDATGYAVYADRSAYNTVRRTISLIDLVLLNADQLGVTAHGPHALTENAWRALLQRISSSCESSEAVYQWSTKLRSHLLRGLEGEDLQQLQAMLAMEPELNEITIPEDEWMLQVDREQIPLLRAMLWRQGRYTTECQSEFRLQPSIRGLATEIYADTLAGALALLPAPRELCIGVAVNRSREFRAVPVTADISPKRSAKDVKRLIACIDRSNLLSAGLGTPEVAIDSLESLLPFLDLKSHQRFRSIPVEAGFSVVRRSIELFLDLGDDLVKAYANLTDAAVFSNRPIADVVSTKGIFHFISPRLKELGVLHWSVSPKCSTLASQADFFSRLRANQGLYELLRVVAGATQMLIGSIAARRADELVSLRSGQALDADRSRLVFAAGKKNVGEHRQIEARPVPPIAVEMVDYIERFHGVFAEARGVRKGDLRLFAPMLGGGGFRPGRLRGPTYYRAMDLFCDYVETDRDQHGRRFYIRQHQLRRWFAMLFFWANSFGGSETLRWFLGHTDMQHLYHYVTDAVPGSILRSAAAAWATAAILAERPETVSLAQLARSHFGTHDFRIVDARRLEIFVEDLLADGRARVEPIFFDFGRRCEIGVQIAES